MIVRVSRLAGASLAVGPIGLLVTHWVVFGLLFILSVVVIAVSWARTKTRVAPDTSGLAKPEDLRRADDEDGSPMFGDAVSKGGGVGGGGVF
jgi:hypothetical protein